MKRILLVVVMAVLIVAVSAVPALALAIGTTRCEKSGDVIIRPLGKTAIRVLEAKGWTCTPATDDSSISFVQQGGDQDSENDGDLED